MRVSLGALLGALATCPRALTQGFLTNCSWKAAILVNSWLGMYCNNDDWASYDYEWSWLDTGFCLANIGGQLTPHDSGEYWTSCKGCAVRGSPIDFTLNCTCLWTPGRVTTATYDLNRIIWNVNGSLGCFAHYGNKTRVGPYD
ncbi:hypothetical protein F5Y18DRAFT_264049 [Xylariaceae sp. FL1019]|nr:hypothetical protein F5Y18DRAFT_264049 [Xylariaceae sp. FL1019]